jgi:hypothetical protein
MIPILWREVGDKYEDVVRLHVLRIPVTRLPSPFFAAKAESRDENAEGGDVARINHQ